jgi:hypothetical protein
MTFALNLDDNGRVLSATFPQYAPENAVLVDSLPNGDIADYRYEDGEFVYDPLPQPVLPEEDDLWSELAAAIREGVNEA